MIRRSSQNVRPWSTIWAAATVLCNFGTGSAQVPTQSCNGSSMPAMASVPSYPLVDKWRQSHDTWLLRFSLPSDRKHLGDDPSFPTCISVHHNSSLDGGKLLKKSYSPISHPATEGSFDLLVKSYQPQPGGGVGDALCNLQPGKDVLVGKLKSERMVHGSPTISRRWDRIGLVAGGTGVAPLVQIVRIILDDPYDRTKIYMLSINRYEEDILIRDELDRMATEHPGRFSVTYSLTGGNVSKDWKGFTGRGSVEMARKALPPPSAKDGQSTMVFVCGTDGFRDMWAGPIARAPSKADGSKGPKIQGPLLGVLKDAGYDATDVFKY
eukprot:CAMPEP_0172536676 /NCGR_PEP_ID=MMETSP1067-20121228/8412_1 /TAXON_ID=265564 ORGANISM="Thalassiosira punctigera, Strain Tpunct2005C2" /NCGR_SAMPLE_ID=MMETSP1067 /ASSEMBLY_ACC=CAM_ASM_000444 /LENGTH=323 /DNA_ID=CAMNT_0013321805 /DNA_START=25 /DNA_END=996 /DNA_ORIENTATION=+